MGMRMTLKGLPKIMLFRLNLTALTCLLFLSVAYAETNICFTPGEKCLPLVVKEIDAAQKRVWLQGYYLTSKPIARALVNAKNRGLDVQVILDKSQEHTKYSQLGLLFENAVPVFIDRKPAIAHNKIIIIDESTVMTGSYNWTDAAEHKNAENLLIIKDDPALLSRYVQNFEIRKRASDEGQ